MSCLTLKLVRKSLTWFNLVKEEKFLVRRSLPMFLLLPLTMSLFTSSQEQVDGDMCIIGGWPERELHANALKSHEIMSLISAAGLQKTVTQVGRCYEVW